MSTVGGPRLSTIPTFKNTYSMDFDGVDDYLDLGTESTVASGNQFTLSFWIKGNSQSGARYLFSADYYNLHTFWTIQNTELYWRNINNNYKLLSSNLLDGDWHHILIVYNPDGADETIRCFTDGTNQVDVVTDFRYRSVGGLYDGPLRYIGNRGGGTFPGFNGNIDEFAVWNDDQSANVSTIYNGGAPNDLTDLSPDYWLRNGDNGSWKSPQFLLPNNSNKNKLSNYSFEFDGIDDYVDCGDSDTFSFGNGTTDSPFSISAWIKMDDASAFRIASKYTNTDREYIFTTDSSDRLSFALYDLSSGGRIQRKYNTALTSFQGQWINVVGTYDGNSLSSGILLYLNGIRVDDIDGNLGSYTAMENTTQPFEIGRNNLTSFANGKIDELSVFDKVLTPTEITSIASAPTDLTDLSPIAWYRMGEEANFTSNWLVDNSALDNYSKRSFAFDGVDDYIELGSISHLQNATEYSVSSWFKSPLNNLNQVIWGWFDGADGYLQLLLISDGSFVVYNYRTSTAYGLSATGLVSADTWYNALVVFDGGGATNADRLKLYINGNPITLTYTGTIPTQTGTMLINTMWLGASNSPNFWGLEGNIDEVSIFDSAISIGDVWDGSGEPIDVSAVSGLANYYKMGEEATFNTNWTVPDQVGTNNGTSNAMLVDALVGEAPNYSGGGISNGMTIEDRIGSAPSSSNNAVSFNMDLIDRVEDTP